MFKILDKVDFSKRNFCGEHRECSPLESAFFTILALLVRPLWWYCREENTFITHDYIFCPLCQIL